MVAKVLTASVIGLDAEVVEVEADVAGGLPATIIVGLPDAQVQESKERIRSAMRSADTKFPVGRVAVNLAPADLQKTGTHFDLPIALAILLSSQQIHFDPAKKMFLGELALDGRLRAVPGVLSVALLASTLGYSELFVPEDNAKEAGLLVGIKIYPVRDLKSLILHLLGIAPLSELVRQEQVLSDSVPEVDFAHIAGQEYAKRALEIACAGAHNVLMSGPPGSGKTLLAKAMVGILPNLTLEEKIELTRIYSVAGLLTSGGLVLNRPVRNPHHTTSTVAVVGGGTNPKPGEVTLAHRGVLFLDEFPEFPRPVLEALRQPLEDGLVTVSRAKSTLTFPAKFILVAARNPCPCGYFGDPHKPCVCSPALVIKYQNRISGPLMDRIDLHVEVPRLSFEKIREPASSENSFMVRERVESARKKQYDRFGCAKTNGEMSPQEVKLFCSLTAEGEEVLKSIVVRYSLSGRGVSRLLKVARTIADLDKQENIETHHLLEASQYRPIENKAQAY